MCTWLLASQFFTEAAQPPKNWVRPNHKPEGSSFQGGDMISWSKLLGARACVWYGSAIPSCAWVASVPGKKFASFPPSLFLLGKKLTISVAICHTWGSTCVPTFCCLLSWLGYNIAFTEPTLPVAPRIMPNCRVLPKTVFLHNHSLTIAKEKKNYLCQTF